MILAIWVMEIMESVFGAKFSWLGTHPRHLDEWYTIFTGALVHSDWAHLINNTYPLLILGLFILIQFGKYSWVVFLSTFSLSGLFIFIFARSGVYHIGASGVVYCWAAFLAASGFWRRDRLSLALGLAVAFLYGGMIWGIFPVQEGVSWDGHLWGAISGILAAYFFRNLSKPKPVKSREDLSDEDYDVDRYGDGGFEYLRRKRRKGVEG